MANVEVQLDVKAEYKQALAAIAMLGKALDAVQQRAKMALSVTGGAQSGANGADGAGKAEAEQKAAVEALSAAMKDAAAAAAMLTESVSKLTPALEAMGPQADQVQQVLTLAEHYKQLAAAMGIAADAAAKYNASGAQQGETDARIQKLMEENQTLMELVSNIREEYAAIVRRNVELNRTRKEREENNKAVREEMEITQNLTYQMQLAAMSKRELVAEIDRLIKARKEAAKAGDESKYKELTEELRLARQAMTKLRQEQQLARIAWMQQAQTAQQMGQNIRTLAEGMTGFSESVENGTVNLTGMVSAVMSLSMAIKAGLGPLGWALLAVEALSTAWNSYAKSQKEAEEAEKKRQEKIAKVTAAYIEAREAAEEFHKEEARTTELKNILSFYQSLNTELEKTKELSDNIYRIESARVKLNAKEDEYELQLKRNQIERDFISGKIDEEERGARLDALNVEKELLRAQRTEKQNELKLNRETRGEAALQALLGEANAKVDKVSGQNRLKMNLADAKTVYSEANMQDSYEDRMWMIRRKLGKYAPETFIEYKQQYEHEQKRLTEAKDEADKLYADLLASQAKIKLLKAEISEDAALSEQSITHAKGMAADNAETRKVKRDAKARKEQERERLRIEKEEDKIMQQYADSIEAAEWSVAKSNKSRFKGKNASAVNWLLNTALPAAADGEMTSKQLATLIKAWEQAQKTKAKTDDEMVRVIANMLNDQKISDKKTRQKITAIRKNLR